MPCGRIVGRDGRHRRCSVMYNDVMDNSSTDDDDDSSDNGSVGSSTM